MCDERGHRFWLFQGESRSAAGDHDNAASSVPANTFMSPRNGSLTRQLDRQKNRAFPFATGTYRAPEGQACNQSQGDVVKALLESDSEGNEPDPTPSDPGPGDDYGHGEGGYGYGEGGHGEGGHGEGGYGEGGHGEGGGDNNEG